MIAATLILALVGCASKGPSVAIPNATPAPENIRFAGPIDGTLTLGRNRYEPTAVEPSSDILHGQTHSTECYEWNLSDGTHEFEVHVYGTAGTTALEIQMSNEGPLPVGHHDVQIFSSDGGVAVIPDAAASDAQLWYQTPDVGSHSSFWTVAANKRTGTIDAWLWQGPNGAPPGGDLHVYGQWSC